MIVNCIFEHCLLLKQPTYLDIGAHHPTYLINTAFFYLKGLRGVCIEPDPFLFAEFKKERKKDTCLNVGIGIGRLHQTLS